MKKLFQRLRVGNLHLLSDQSVTLVPQGTKRLGGAFWILRDSNGVVLMHSRRSFTPIDSCIDAKLMTFLWAIDSM